MQMIPLLLIRHGKTEWNLQKKLQGRRDIALSNIGEDELKSCTIPKEFAKFKWRVSPLMRALQTAELLKAPSYEIDKRLIEMDFGLWEGKTIKELRSEYGRAMLDNEAKGIHMQPPNGESPFDVQQRLHPFLKELREPTIAVTHKGVIRALKSLAYNWDMTDKFSQEFRWNAAHLFEIDAQGQPHAIRINIELDEDK
jgi:probable phosphoglycerate mutase